MAASKPEIAIVAEESVESRTLVFPVYNAQPIRGWPCRMLNPIHPVQPAESKGRAQLIA